MSKVIYPAHAHKSNKEWLKDVRKRWMVLRKILKSDDSPQIGCAFYPEEVYRWISEFQEVDKAMKEYYKNA